MSAKESSEQHLDLPHLARLTSMDSDSDMEGSHGNKADVPQAHSNPAVVPDTPDSHKGSLSGSLCNGLSIQYITQCHILS